MRRSTASITKNKGKFTDNEVNKKYFMKEYHNGNKLSKFESAIFLVIIIQQLKPYYLSNRILSHFKNLITLFPTLGVFDNARI